MMANGLDIKEIGSHTLPFSEFEKAMKMLDNREGLRIIWFHKDQGYWERLLVKGPGGTLPVHASLRGASRPDTRLEGYICQC